MYQLLLKTWLVGFFHLVRFEVFGRRGFEVEGAGMKCDGMGLPEGSRGKMCDV